ncbi:MAG: hypothetical protein VX737_04620 [Pseudomonadota bacterium]|nr:hypothetical protein [Pseudomonadota bacterium]
MSLFRKESDDAVKPASPDYNGGMGMTSGANTEPVVNCLVTIVDQVLAIKSHVDEASKHAEGSGQGMSMFKGESQGALDELRQSLEDIEAGAEDLYNQLSGQVYNEDKPSQS